MSYFSESNPILDFYLGQQPDSPGRARIFGRGITRSWKRYTTTFNGCLR